ncbi:MAG: hypothetical protein KQ78_02237 [Candidatus Izimaplasma bacterium HR2]|nr:MAG: hypothetical protein KQ78_02237 [Candidatus Izimaplasma bacterium HR2]
MKKYYGGIFNTLIKSEGYTLIGEYKNSYTKVKIKCPEGHEYSVTPSNFKTGYRCPICSGLCPIQAEKEFLELVEREGYELLSEYKNNKTKVKLRCNKGHEYKVRPNDFKTGYRCPICANVCPEQAKEQFIELVEKEGYELIDEYKNNHTKVKLKCPNDHEWETVPSSFKNYIRCPHCAGSTGQRLLQKMLKEHIQEEVIYNDRKALNGLELDIYYPELSIGIEYQGNYWHSKLEQIKRDKRKKELCKEKGIYLIEVWDDDFMRYTKNETEKVVKVLLERKYNE